MTRHDGRPFLVKLLVTSAVAALVATGSLVAAGALEDPPAPPEGSENADGPPDHAVARGHRGLEAGEHPGIAAELGPDGAESADGEGPPDHAVARGYRALLAGEHPGLGHGLDGETDPSVTEDPGPPEHAFARGHGAKLAGEHPGRGHGTGEATSESHGPDDE